jgi:hypothetical protein
LLVVDTTTSNKTAKEYIDDLKEGIEQTRQIVQQHTYKGKSKQTQQYHKTVRGAK